MNFTENWRLLVLAVAAGILLVISFMLPVAAPVQDVTAEVISLEISRAKEKSQSWLNDRQKRFDLKIAQIQAYLATGRDSKQLSEDLIGPAFRTVCLLDGEKPVVWTRYVPDVPDTNEPLAFIGENGQGLALYQFEIPDPDTTNKIFRLVGVSVLSGPTLIADDDAFPTLEEHLRAKGVAVHFNVNGFSKPTAELGDLIAFDEVRYQQNRTYLLLKARVILFGVWFLAMLMLGFLIYKKIRGGQKVIYASAVMFLCAVWLWAGSGFEALLALLSIDPGFAPLVKFSLSSLLLAAQLGLLITYFLAVRRLFGVVWYPRTIAFSLSFGVLSGLVWLFLPTWFSYPLQTEAVQPFAVSLMNNAATVIYFGGVLLSFLPFLIFFTILGRFLFGTEQDQITWVSPLMIAGFAVVFAAYLHFSKEQVSNWTIFSSIGVFLITKQMAFVLYSKPKQFAFFSRIRLISAACLITVLWTYWFMYDGFKKANSERVKAAANQIMVEDRAIADHLARVLPRYLIRKMPFSTLYEESEEVKTAVLEMAKPEWDIFEITLYRVENATIGPPVFSNVRFKQPAEVIENCNLYLKRFDPTVDVSHLRLDQIEPVTVGYAQANEDGQGILAVIRPRYQLSEGPFDEVFERDAFPELAVFSAAYYKKNRLEHRFFHGTVRPEFIPDAVLIDGSKTARLMPEIESDGFKRMTFYYSTEEALVLAYRDLGFSDHVFSAVRFFLTLIVYVFILYGLLLVALQSSPEILTSRQRLQFRILDSYILSSLVFLVLLVVVTQLVITRLAEQEFEDFFERKLEEYRQELSKKDLVTWLDFEYNSDYLLFEGPYLLQSSRTGLTSTGKLPESMPFTLYRTMMDEEQPRFIKVFAVSGKPLVAGVIRMERVTDGMPLFVIFPQIRDLTKQAEYLFRTTSFLFIIYVSMFGLFIAGAAFISRHLSRPLADLSAGLRKVATGEFSATVPVTSQDEVGDLANAYNLMIYKLQDLQKELSEVERQAALSEMARQVAHEIKNPLTPMKLSIQFLQRQILQREQPIEELQAAVDRICKTVIEQIDSLNAIASDFSRFAKPLAGSFRKNDINKLATDIIDLYRHDRRISIVSDLYEMPLYVHGIGDELKRVFINLVKNSDEAMPEGGVIIVRTYPYKEQVFVEIVDNGSGIPVEQQSRLFTPNFSTKTSGTGLGLAICKKVVEAHKGEISFASVEGAGTTFTLVFPAWKETDGAQLAFNSPDFV